MKTLWSIDRVYFEENKPYWTLSKDFEILVNDPKPAIFRNVQELEAVCRKQRRNNDIT